MISFNEISFRISDYGYWLYIIGMLYFIVLIGENYKGDLCSFLNESKFGIKNIFISLVIFISPLLHVNAVAFLKSIGIEEVIIRASEIGLVVLELLFVVAVGYWYIFVFIAVIIVFLIILSLLGALSGALAGDIGMIIGSGAVIYWYFPYFMDFTKSLLIFPKNLLACIASEINLLK